MFEMKVHVIPVTPFAQNCSLLWCPETMKGALVDPGGEVDRILTEVEKQGVELERILVTHPHIDHAGGAAELAERLNVPIEGPHKDDKFLVDSLPDQGARFGLEPARAFTPTRWLEDGDQVSLGKVTLEVRHCPGHTPGHIIFFDAESKIALVGDVLFRGSIGRTDLPGGSYDTLVKSITERLWPLGKDTAFVSGHGDVSTIGTERQSNPFVCDLALGTD
jgi:glyoxylase-like metal-dependent hydrolase (beta-lactamase superfamily II)